MIGLQSITVFVGPETEITADGGTLDVEIGSEYQLQFFALPLRGADESEYEALAAFFRRCMLACEDAAALKAGAER